MTQIGTKLLEEPGDSALEQIIARTEAWCRHYPNG